MGPKPMRLKVSCSPRGASRVPPSSFPLQTGVMPGSVDRTDRALGENRSRKTRRKAQALVIRGSEGSRRGWTEGLMSRTYRTWDDLFKEEVWAPGISIAFDSVLGSHQTC